MRKTRQITAFTLVELLVVIAIIALLLTFLGPPLWKARRQAQNAKCAANLHKISVAFELYAQHYDYRRFVLRKDWSETDLYWMGKLADYIDGDDYGKIYRLGETIEVLLCPTAPDTAFIDDISRANASGTWGMNDRPWLWWRSSNISTLGSYTINGWMAYDFYYEDNPQEYPFVKEHVFGNWDRVRPETPIFGDGLWTAGWPQGTDAAPPDLMGSVANPTLLDSPPGGPRHMWRFCLDRHTRKINIITKDLSIQAVELEELWSMPWHKDYQYPEEPIQLP